MIHTVLAHRSMRTKALSWVCSAALLAEVELRLEAMLLRSQHKVRARYDPLCLWQFYSCDGTLSPEAPRPCVGNHVD